MRIAIGIKRLMPRGGLEDHAIRLAGELASRGHEVVLHTTTKVPDPGIATVLLPAAPRRTNHRRMAAFADAFGRAVAGKFDRIVGLQPMPGLDVLLLADHLRDRPDAPRWKRLLPRFHTFARLEAACFGPGARTRIMGLARPQMLAYAARYPESRTRIVILPPTISADRHRPHLRQAELRAAARRRLDIDDSAKVWLWLGLQPRIKGLDRAVEALASVADAVLVVGGVPRDDRRARPILRQAARLGVADRVRWPGFLAGDELFAAIAAADALAHPSRFDVTGAVILEALVNGLPAVATAECGFAHHITESGAGRVIPSPFDAATFAAMLAEVCGPENAALSARGIAYGDRPLLYSGLAVACDLIEAADWPRGVTLAADG